MLFTQSNSLSFRLGDLGLPNIALFQILFGVSVSRCLLQMHCASGLIQDENNCEAVLAAAGFRVIGHVCTRTGRGNRPRASAERAQAA